MIIRTCMSTYSVEALLPYVGGKLASYIGGRDRAFEAELFEEEAKEIQEACGKAIDAMTAVIETSEDAGKRRFARDARRGCTEVLHSVTRQLNEIPATEPEKPLIEAVEDAYYGEAKLAIDRIVEQAVLEDEMPSQEYVTEMADIAHDEAELKVWLGGHGRQLEYPELASGRALMRTLVSYGVKDRLIDVSGLPLSPDYEVGDYRVLLPWQDYGIRCGSYDTVPLGDIVREYLSGIGKTPVGVDELEQRYVQILRMNRMNWVNSLSGNSEGDGIHMPLKSACDTYAKIPSLDRCGTGNVGDGDDMMMASLARSARLFVEKREPKSC